MDAIRRAAPPVAVIVMVGLLFTTSERSDLQILIGGGCAAVVLAILAAVRWSLDPGERLEIVHTLRRRQPSESTS